VVATYATIAIHQTIGSGRSTFAAPSSSGRLAEEIASDLGGAKRYRQIGREGAATWGDGSLSSFAPWSLFGKPLVPNFQETTALPLGGTGGLRLGLRLGVEGQLVEQRRRDDPGRQSLLLAQLPVASAHLVDSTPAKIVRRPVAPRR
jgi:hypothetical protein